MHDIAVDLKRPLIELLLSIADDKFMLGHRVGDWTGLAPILEEDIAFSSIAQDELAHAQAFYQFIADIEGGNADLIAFGRKPSEYRCATLTTLPDDLSWDVAIARQFYCDHFDAARLARLSRSSNRELASLAGRVLAEERIHVDHADHWVAQLGQAPGEPRDRLQAALNRLAPQAAALFEPTSGVDALERAGLYPSSSPDMFEAWRTELDAVASSAGLKLHIPDPRTCPPGGRTGRHAPGFVELLDELTEVFRTEPQAQW